MSTARLTWRRLQGPGGAAVNLTVVGPGVEIAPFLDMAAAELRTPQRPTPGPRRQVPGSPAAGSSAYQVSEQRGLTPAATGALDH